MANTDKKYTERDLEIAERLTAVEGRLTGVDDRLVVITEGLASHRKESADRAGQLQMLFDKLGIQIEESKFSWSKLGTVATHPGTKLMLWLLLTLAGLGGGAAVLLQ